MIDSRLTESKSSNLVYIFIAPGCPDVPGLFGSLSTNALAASTWLVPTFEELMLTHMICGELFEGFADPGCGAGADTCFTPDGWAPWAAAAPEGCGT